MQNVPVVAQEKLYRLPYHWFPEDRLKAFERNEKQRIIIDLLNRHLVLPPDRYLDVGCGDGRWTTDIHDYIVENLTPNVSSVGVDFSEQAIGFARLISPHIVFEVHEGGSIPSSPASFDLITAIEVLEHVQADRETAFLSELRRLLKPDGLLILTTPSWNLRLPSHHFRHYSINQLTELLSKNGFNILSIRGQSMACYGLPRKMRKMMSQFPKIWKFWKFTYQETTPAKALNLILAARPR